MIRRFLRFAPALAVTVFLLPAQTRAWGGNGQRLIVNRAIGTLPPDLRPFFEASQSEIARHVTDPMESLARNPAERRFHVLMLDRYGRFPFDSLPRNYKAALAKFGKRKLEAGGVLPWQIGVFSQKLTDAFRAGDWDEVRVTAALLAHYVAGAHDPFNTTDDFDGRLSGQPGVQTRFGSALVDRYSLFFPMRPNDASFIRDPTDHAFEACLSAHSWLENILLADRRARAGRNDFSDEYYDRFYNQAGAVLIRQLSDAATDVGSYWLTAWINAGRPPLPER